MGTTVTVAIPARIGSSRFPGKVLKLLDGKPLLFHVWSRALEADVGRTVVLTDSGEICEMVREWGGTALLTSPNCTCGTERIAMSADRLGGDFFVNVQADQPMLDPSLIVRVARRYIDYGQGLVTVVYPLERSEQIENPNVVKAIRDNNGNAFYFSRSPIPYIRDIPRAQWPLHYQYWGHVGIYGYTQDVLQVYKKTTPASLEDAERLEQMRLVQHGYRFDTIESVLHSDSVNVPEDLERLKNR